MASEKSFFVKTDVAVDGGVTVGDGIAVEGDIVIGGRSLVAMLQEQAEQIRLLTETVTKLQEQQ